MRINVMRKGERFVSMNGNQVVLKDRKGEVRIVWLEWDGTGIRIIPEKEIRIGYGLGTVQAGDMDGGIEVTNF